MPITLMKLASLLVELDQIWAVSLDFFNNILQSENWSPVTGIALNKSNHGLPNAQRIQARENIAILPVTALILPHETKLSQLLGATTLDTFTKDFQQRPYKC